jgi:hypothetical protein
VNQPHHQPGNFVYRGVMVRKLVIPYEVGPDGQRLMYSWRVQASALMDMAASAEEVKRAIDGHLDAPPGPAL